MQSFFRGIQYRVLKTNGISKPILTNEGLLSSIMCEVIEINQNPIQIFLQQYNFLVFTYIT